ncbi:hypothetical protein Dtox_4322 [Desulfofarcimen acetoxidans DSM 771]|jgi:hypothetical protein|uniref:Uncharacterized protein n=1 Tax=Desulfofarcimen acetoxidans (strain ATCC 49208 / DSM 771 / KCTC 5769 / VKM B-1644 / 5575) TaxID=485916 RepID=C8W018_DESAS|nr:hypothetical protein [Desulfofarcimen acetoxidans]ACV64986.1 hypothetical protein Dtox_4322 [Desulfofarcimen acetoxidans DSM 771]
MNNSRAAVDLQKIKEEVINTYNVLITEVEQSSDREEKNRQINTLKEAVNQTEQLVKQYFSQSSD